MNKLQDERVLIAKRKIQSDGFQIVWLVLVLSVLIQQYLYQAPFAQYAVELFVFIAMSLYLLIANIGKGNNVFASKTSAQSTLIINSLVTGVIVTAINTIINYINYEDNIQTSIIAHIALVAGITFVCSTSLAYVALKITYTINKKKQQTIEKKLNDEETDD